ARRAQAHLAGQPGALPGEHRDRQRRALERLGERDRPERRAERGLPELPRAPLRREGLRAALRSSAGGACWLHSTARGRTDVSYKDYYAVLGVKRDASAQEIQRAYRKLARTYHPDVSKEPGAEARFKEV